MKILKKILENITGVEKIVPQNEWSYHFNILKYKPDIMVHGDDWNLSQDGKELKIDALFWKSYLIPKKASALKEVTGVRTPT